MTTSQAVSYTHLDVYKRQPLHAPVAAPSAAQLEAFIGEFTDPHEPDTPVSFSVNDGKLFVETERNPPAELKPLSALDFGLPDAKNSYRFTLDQSGRALSLVHSTEPEIVYRRTGPPVHHLFHDYQRTEAMIPMRDGVRLHAVILTPADIPAPLPFLIQRTPYGVCLLYTSQHGGGLTVDLAARIGNLHVGR